MVRSRTPDPEIDGVTVVGVSMEPFLRAGERVSVVLADEEEVQVGDLVVIERGPMLVLHRAVRREGTRWRTRGDAWAQLDPVKNGERLVARVPGLRLGTFVFPDRFATPSVRRALVTALPFFARARGLVRRLGTL